MARVREVSAELINFLYRLSRAHKRSIASQYIRAFATSRQDDKELANILSRLDRARSELTARIQIAHFSMTANIYESFAAVMSPRERASHRKNSDRNIQSSDRATIICGDVGAVVSPGPSLAMEFQDCRASGESVQVYGTVDLPSFRELLSRRENRGVSHKEDAMGVF